MEVVHDQYFTTAVACRYCYSGEYPVTDGDRFDMEFCTVCCGTGFVSQPSFKARMSMRQKKQSAMDAAISALYRAMGREEEKKDESI